MSNQAKVPEQMEAMNGEKKRVRLTIGVKPEDDRDGKKSGPKVGAELWNEGEV